MIEQLVKALRSRQAILFVGAGVSRHLKLPSWGELIDEMADQLGYDAPVFREHGGYLELAEFYKLQMKSIGPLRSWMDRTWHIDEGRIASSKVHELIVGLKVPTIYTTNFDRWLEIAFRHYKTPYAKIANVGDFAKLVDDATQIVKFHGDFDDDESIVLTETNYFERLSFESPLDIKLRSDSLGKSILFIGYSLSDINIRYLLYKLHRLWADSAYAMARPQSYIFSARPNPVQEEILRHRGITAIVSNADDPGQGLIEFLEQLRAEAFGSKV